MSFEIGSLPAAYYRNFQLSEDSPLKDEDIQKTLTAVKKRTHQRMTHFYRCKGETFTAPAGVSAFNHAYFC